ncbi:MAG: hypothetical protein OXM03_08960 [Chloroflexota bacterium]|nr:hypothetical protein [Chloroflexota bacterium]MDE2840741.1 hypothetical protein [Chloroflexota bacterium]MDE2931781.1 hypothetical protein [Chloroflexota bacterium]
MARIDAGIPLSIVKVAFTPAYITELIDCVLRWRDEASGGVRKGLDSAINASIKLDGFRYSSKAQLSQLRDPLLWEVTEGNDRLIGQLLRTWAESQKELHDSVQRYLTERDMPADGPDLRQGTFFNTWPRDEWKDAIGTVATRNPECSRDDVRMMVCYLSGLAERLLVVSEPLAACILELRALAVDAADWRDVDDFVDIVRDIADNNAERRAVVFVERCQDALRQAQSDFATELEYLEIDIAGWAQQAAERPAAITDALELAEELRDNLADYQRIRPQAPFRKQEEERKPERDKRELAILTIANEWEEMIVAALNDSGSPAKSGEDNAPMGDSTGPAPTEDIHALRAERGRLERERDSLKSESDLLAVENDRLAQANSGLQAENQSLDSENGQLRAKLTQSRDLEEYWRRFYGASPFEQVRNVNEAVARAKELFPEQLVFALNSKSDKDSPFQKPAEVLAALAWLATDYHHLRWTKPGEDPRFEERLKKPCPGWSYKPHQANATKQQFAEWYETGVEGRRYELGEHLGKGTSADPQKTLRIAFAWDDERGQVIVGYIGLHQRNRRS